MVVRLSALPTCHTLFPRNMIIFVLLVLISVKQANYQMLQELIAGLKQQLASLEMLHKQKTDGLKAEHSCSGQSFFSLRKEVLYSRKFDEKQLSFLIISSNEVIKVCLKIVLRSFRNLCRTELGN
jgi:hypothetical protein